MSKEWEKKLASDIESKYGKDIRDKLFGDIDALDDSHKSISAWFDNFITGMDELNDKEFLRYVMMKNCPCGSSKEETIKHGKIIKENYDKCKTLEEFLLFLKTCDSIGDAMELKGNILYLIKPLSDDINNIGKYGKGCHCGLAKHTEKTVSDIFCYCCTIAHTGNQFKVAFGDDIKMEFIESIICGGKECTMAVYLPEKNE